MSGQKLSLSPSTQDILTTLDSAEKLFWADLGYTGKRGRVLHVRDAVVSLALIRALQTSLGKAGKEGPILAANLLGSSPFTVQLCLARLNCCSTDTSASITLRREMLDAIQNKFPDVHTFDDLQWPLMTPNGTPLPRQKNRHHARLEGLTGLDDEEDTEETSLKRYWETIKAKYKSQVFDATSLSTSRVEMLPSNWTVVNISVTEDKSTMFMTRQRANTEPLMFCLPLKGRRENDEDEHLTFDDALSELREIIKLSDEGTRRAVNVMNDDPQARAAWWAERSALDKRMQELLENIEFCWLGAFKVRV
jgi:separase